MAPEEDYRRHMRIHEETMVSWRIENTERSGDGLIRDISVSGILLEVGTFVTPDKNAIFILKPTKDENELFVPDRARLVWAKAMKMETGKYLCGLEFIKPPDSIVAKIAQRVENWFTEIAEAANVNILDNYFRGKDRNSI